MELNLHQLEIFLCIARERSFSKAADKLRISQPAVSIQIKNLEEFLEVKLFERLGRNVYLTRAGTAVLERANKISELVSVLRSEIEEIKENRRGQLSAGCSRVPSATLVPLAVGHFKERFPDIEIAIKTGRSHEVEQWVLENLVELGVIEGDPASGLIVKDPWYTDELVLVLSPRSHLLKKRKLVLKEVVNEPFLIQSPGIRPTFVERVLADKGLCIGNRIILGSREAVKTAVATGSGVSIMPQSLIDTERRAGVLKARKIQDLDVRYPVNLIYRKDKQLSPSVLAFAEILKQQNVKANVLPLFRPARKDKPRLVS
ncbi:MAG: LysR family transcriptional regulator [Candidatus Binatia bacterium]